MIKNCQYDHHNKALAKCWYLHNNLRYWRDYVLYRVGIWKSPSPGMVPHIVKRKIICAVSKEYDVKVFIETGTYLGDMIQAMYKHFDKLYTIELNEKLYEQSCKRFSLRKNVYLYCGDSSIELPKILYQVKSKALFWLDAHYSAGITSRGSLDTPIMQELMHIMEHSVKGHVILIDDARDFKGDNDYPTIHQLKTFLSQWPSYEVSVANDIIHVLPRKHR